MSRKLETQEKNKESWRSSQGYLREKPAEKGEKLTGYSPTKREVKEKDEPQKITDFTSSFGSFSVGSNKKKEMVMITSQERSEEESVRNESRTFEGQGAISLQQVQGMVKVNSSRGYESAIEAKEEPLEAKADTRVQGTVLMGRMTRFMNKKDFKVQQEITPFLTNEKEKTKLDALREKANIYYKTSGNESEKMNVEKEIEEVETLLNEKERQKKRMTQRLSLARAKAKKQEIKSDWDNIDLNFTETLDADLGEEGNDDEENNKNDGEEEKNKGKKQSEEQPENE